MALSGSGTSTALSPFAAGYYTLARLVSIVRERLDDMKTDYLWSDAEITANIDQIQKELCAELALIIDRSTAEICEVAVVAGQSVVALDLRINGILKAWLQTAEQPLRLATAEEMDGERPRWDIDLPENGTPTILIHRGVGHGMARLYVPPELATDTLKLVVHRMPLYTLDYTEHADAPLEIDRVAHLILNGVLALCYSKHDSETEDRRRAADYLALWQGRNGLGGDKDQIRRLVIKEQGPQYAVPHQAYL